jgi:hypothetical protein
MNNLDLATGTVSTAGKLSNGTFSTHGSVDANERNQVLYSTAGESDTLSVRHRAPPPAKHECYMLAPQTCTDDETEAIRSGNAVIQNYIFKSYIKKPRGGTRPKSKGPKSSSASPRRSGMRNCLVNVLACITVGQIGMFTRF